MAVTAGREHGTVDLIIVKEIVINVAELEFEQLSPNNSTTIPVNWQKKILSKMNSANFGDFFQLNLFLRLERLL